MASPSAVTAAEDAVQNTVDSLFRPFRLERWIALGFVAFLDQCSSLASSTCQVRWPRGEESENEQWRDMVRAAAGWLGEHPLWPAGIAAVVLTFVVAVTVVVLW